MTTTRRMPALSPEEIRRISDNAVATVAAQKIVTSRAVSVNASVQGKVMSNVSHSNVSNETGRNLTQRERARSYLVRTGLSQSDGRKYLQASFDQVRKTFKS
ncbi:hypothetical protein FXN80_08660 [Dickeya fangzhongdai]|uniref:hypothetical protein n=1 Tax=Dickeya fangzhongdai TaxID=1778540 RepID=UPI00136AEC4B|nr:hypothetical protein [Dickeya fangzhongdai]UMB78448.1 hypothetical protein FXN80_08660 [Dickeya fangzhongdai]